MNSRVLPARGVLLPALVPGVCQVWWARPGDVDPLHDALLAPVDLLRRARLRQQADRHRLTVATAVLRMVVGTHVGVPPAWVVIDRSCPGCGGQHGKPRLPGLHVSVSHSGGTVAVAVGLDGPVGVDVEELGQHDPSELERLVVDVLAPEEQAALAQLTDRNRVRGFLAYWTRKEALVKATGDGLSTPLDSVVVSRPSESPRLLRWEGQEQGVSLHTLDAPRDVVGTLAVLGERPVHVVGHDAGPLLRAWADG
jgi:4'-phosphopantetheinyl transferase